MIAHRLNRREETSGMRVKELPSWYCDCGQWASSETDEDEVRKAHREHVAKVGKRMDLIGC